MAGNLENYPRSRILLILLLLTMLAMAIAGYHPGVEDDAVYLSAIKKDLNPALYPHDADFFRVQLQATIFDKLVAGSALVVHLPVEWTVLAWQFASIFLLLLACWDISCRCFSEPQARWSAVTLVALLLTLPVSGTALYLVDQYLHPRALASAAVLAAVAAILDGRRIVAAVFLLIALVLHPLMASFGISYCVFLSWKQQQPRVFQAAAVFLPLGWVFESTSPAWRQAAATRNYYFLSRWHWYEWLGVIGPILLVWWFARIAQRSSNAIMAQLASRLVLFNIFQLIVAVGIMLPEPLVRLKPFQPMRYLHLVYLLFILLAGGLIGRSLLRRHAYRWALLFLPLALGMFYAQRQTFPATEHLEWPRVSPRNPWVQAFAWVRQNTPIDSYFALDPYYMQLPGEDFHNFRALAARSVLADYVKDPSVATQVPRLAPRWQKEVSAQADWKNFQHSDFERLKAEFGVNWVVLVQPGVPGMFCPYSNRAVLVCRVE